MNKVSKLDLFKFPLLICHDPGKEYFTSTSFCKPRRRYLPEPAGLTKFKTLYFLYLLQRFLYYIHYLSANGRVQLRITLQGCYQTTLQYLWNDSLLTWFYELPLWVIPGKDEPGRRYQTFSSMILVNSFSILLLQKQNQKACSPFKDPTNKLMIAYCWRSRKPHNTLFLTGKRD